MPDQTLEPREPITARAREHLMPNVTLPLREAVAICEAQNEIWDIGQFEFRLRKSNCAYCYLDGVESYSVPDEVKPELEAILKATDTFEQQILAIKLDAREVSLFLSEYFGMKARTVAERQILQTLGPQLRPDGITETSLFSMVLEEEMRRVMSQLVIEVTDEMLQAKIKDMGGEIR
jgi:hypothetical protein